MKIERKPTCFVSYCREGIDRPALDLLIQTLREEAVQKVEFLYDEDLDAGARLPVFMDLIQHVDAVMMILTPEYKIRTEERKGGVYVEFSEVLSRYDQQTEKSNSSALTYTEVVSQISTPFPIIPIVLSGSFEKSCPKELQSNLTLDFTSFRALKKPSGEYYISSVAEARHKKHLRRVIDQIVVSNTSKATEVGRSFEELCATFLSSHKHEHAASNPYFRGLLGELFVKTYAFRKIKSQISFLLVGRKGSGKSTIVDYLSRDFDDKYKDAIQVNVNEFDLEYMYSVLTNGQYRSELDIVFPQIKLLEVAWELFLHVVCIHRFLTEHRKGVASRSQDRYVPTLEGFVREISFSSVSSIKEGDLDYRSTFYWCYAKITDSINDAINKSRNDIAGFSYDIGVLLQPEKLTRRLIGDDVLEQFYASLHHCSKRFLVSFDGFDTFFEEFRVRTQQNDRSKEDVSRRTKFEIDWLRGFLHLAVDIKSAVRRNPLFSIVDICATIPKDRFEEVRRLERDSYVYIGKAHEIRWSAIELSILLRKRLEQVSNKRAPKSLRPRRRLDEAFSAGFSYVPLETVTVVDDKEHHLPIFIDVIRHTFWRPREILIYFAKIIAVLSEIKRRDMEITQFTVSKCISDTTREVIRTEFIGEFQRHCINISEIVEKFRRQKQIISLSDTKSLLGEMPFIFADQQSPVLDHRVKLKFLYEIGFLGLEMEVQLYKRLKLLSGDVFSFSAGDEPFEVVSKDEFNGCHFIVHPIFCEFLDLDVRKQRLTLDLDWDYLEKQETHINVA